MTLPQIFGFMSAINKEHVEEAKVDLEVATMATKLTSDLSKTGEAGM